MEYDIAKRVEEENFNLKNRYRLEETTLKYRDKRRLAIDAKKISQVLNHHDQIWEKFETDVGTYQKYKRQKDPNIRHVAAWCEKAYGGMKALRDEIGLKDRHQILPFLKAKDVNRIRDETFGGNPDQDVTLQYLMNALFTPIDMTEYEDIFMGEYYSKRPIPHMDADTMNILHGQMNDYANEIAEPTIETLPLPSLGKNNRQDEKFADFKSAREAL